MVSALPFVDVPQQAAPFCRLDAALENASRAALVELVVDDGVRLGAAKNLSCLQFLCWERAVGEVVEERLCPGGHFVDGADAGQRQLGGFWVRLRSPRVRRSSPRVSLCLVDELGDGFGWRRAAGQSGSPRV